MATVTESVTTTDGVPKGWTKRITQRKIGKSHGKFDIYIFSPDGTKFRSRREIQRYIDKMNVKLNISQFDFSRLSPIQSSITPKRQMPAKVLRSKKTPIIINKKKSTKTKDDRIKVKMNFPIIKKRKISINEEDIPSVPIKKRRTENSLLKVKSNFPLKKSMKLLKVANKKAKKLPKSSVLHSKKISLNKSKEVEINSMDNKTIQTPSKKRGRPKKITEIKDIKETENKDTNKKPSSPETYVDDDLKDLREASDKLNSATEKQILEEIELIKAADKLRYQKSNISEDVSEQNMTKDIFKEASESDEDDMKLKDVSEKMLDEVKKNDGIDISDDIIKNDGENDKIDNSTIIPIIEKTMTTIQQITSNICEETKMVLNNIILTPIGAQVINSTGKRERKKPTWMNDNQYETGDPLAKIKEIAKSSQKITSPKKTLKSPTPLISPVKTPKSVKINSDIKNSTLYKTLKSPLKSSKLLKIPKMPKSQSKELVTGSAKKKRGRPKKSTSQLSDVPCIGEYSDINSFQPSLQPPMNILSDQLNDPMKHDQEVADCEVISIYLDHCYSSRVIADRLEPIAIENNITIPASEMSHAKQSPRTTKAIAQAASEVASSGCARVLPAKNSVSNRSRTFDSFSL